MYQYTSRISILLIRVTPSTSKGAPHGQLKGMPHDQLKGVLHDQLKGARTVNLKGCHRANLRGRHTLPMLYQVQVNYVEWSTSNKSSYIHIVVAPDTTLSSLISKHTTVFSRSYLIVVSDKYAELFNTQCF